MHIKKGFTIIEIIIVIGIIAALSALIGPRVFGVLSKSKYKTTELTLKNVSQALDMYNMDIGKYPVNLESLVEKPKGPEGSKWREAYLPKMPVDGWKNELYYKLTPKTKHPYELYSLGDPKYEGEESYRIDVWSLD